MNPYQLFEPIASGGMGTVHYGRATGASGLSRVVAIKRMHGELARDPACMSMFHDELRLAARVRHPNVVATLDIVEQDRELLLVMEYVQGESLQELIARSAARGEAVPAAVAVSVVCGILQGLESAHEARSETGEPLGIVHRDVSPENVLVGRDGIARLLDFGIARSAGRKHVTRVGEIKGKPSYLAPEQILNAGRQIDRRADVYGAACVLWEALTGRRLFDAESPTVILSRVLNDEVPPPSALAPSLPSALDDVVLRGLSRDPEARFATALEMARALSAVCPSLLPFEVAEWVEALAGDSLARQREQVARIEAAPRDFVPGQGAASAEQTEAPPETLQTPTALEESMHAAMALAPRRPSALPGARQLQRASAWLGARPELRRGLIAGAIAAVGFATGLGLVGAFVAASPVEPPPAAPQALAAASVEPAPQALVSLPRPEALEPVAKVVAVAAPVVAPVASTAPSSSATARSDKQRPAPPPVSASAAAAPAPTPRPIAARPVVDDGF